MSLEPTQAPSIIHFIKAASPCLTQEHICSVWRAAKRCVIIGTPAIRSSPGVPDHALRDKRFRLRTSRDLRRGNDCRPRTVCATPMASRHPRKAASLARFQPVGEVLLARRAKAVPGRGFPADREARLQLRASADGLSLLDQGRQLGSSSTRRRSRRSTRPSRGAAKYGIHVCINFHRAPGYTVAQPAGENQPLDRPRDAKRLCQALGHVRPPLPRHPQRASELQPDERAGQSRAKSLRGGGPQAGRRPSAAKTRSG